MQTSRQDSEETGAGISVQEETINNLRFADDIDLLEENFETLQQNVELLDKAGERANLKINIGKTKQWYLGKQK